MQQGQTVLRSFFTGALLLTATLVATAVSAETLTVRWDANPETEVIGYMVYIGTAPGPYTQTIDVGNTTQFPFDDAVPGQRYCFSVAAYASGPLLGARSTEVCYSKDQPPLLSNPGNQTTQVGAPVNLVLVGSDPDGLPVT